MRPPLAASILPILPILPLISLLAGCGFAPVEEAVPPVPPAELDVGAVPCPGHTPTFDPDFTDVEWPEAAARALCDRGVDCCTTSVSAYEACVLRERRAIGARSLEARIAAGLVTIDVPAARACLRAFTSERSCAAHRKVPSCLSSATTPIVRPAVEGGGRCLENADCFSGMCIRDAGACGGLCAPTAQVGELCDPRFMPCDPATGWCPDPSAGPDRRCLPLRGEGEGCPGNEACVEGTFCGGGICRRYLEDGEACVERQDRCVGGSSCAGGICARNFQRTSGMPCNSTLDCAEEHRCDGESLTCVPAPAPHARCSSGADCAQNAFCDRSGWCALKRPRFMACENTAWCMDGLSCIGGVCWPPSDAGGVCTRDVSCRYPLICRNGICGLPAAISDRCKTQTDCETGRCVEGLCARLLRVGEVCANATECASGACVKGGDGKSRCGESCAP